MYVLLLHSIRMYHTSSTVVATEKDKINNDVGRAGPGAAAGVGR